LLSLPLNMKRILIPQVDSSKTHKSSTTLTVVIKQTMILIMKVQTFDR
jgi:hypothetical protein